MTNNYLTNNTVPPLNNESSLRVLTKLSTVASKEQLAQSPMTASPRYTPAMMPGSRGVLISGRVSAMENIFEKTPQDASDIFYRVYYQETASATSAKSNIFNSDVVKTFHFDGADASSAAWNKSNNSFPFEMVLPKHVNSICQIDGEILLSFFRMRAQGGNDIIGHLQFTLRDLANRAPSASHKLPEHRKRRTSKYRDVEEEPLDDSLEIRTIEGTFVVCSKSKSGAQYRPMPDGAEVKMRLDLVWRQADYTTEGFVGQDETVSAAPRRPGTAGSTRSGDRSRSPSGSQASSQRSLHSRPGSAGSTRTGASAVASLKEVASKAARAVSREKTRKPAGPVSLHAKVNRERQLKIDRENKLMASKLGKMSTKPKGGAYQGEVAIPKAQPLNAPAEAREPLKTRYADTAEKEASKREIAALTAQWTAAKGEVSALEASNKESSAQVLKFQALIKQCGMTSSRIKKQAAVGSGSIARGEASSKQGVDIDKIMDKYVPLGSSVPTSGGSAADCTGDMIAAQRDKELKELEAVGDCDPELKDNTTELIALQESRRMLVLRIARARDFCAQHSKDCAEMEATTALVQKRLLGAPPASSVGDDVSVSSRATTQSKSKSKTGTRSKPVPKKKAGLYDDEESASAEPRDYDGQLRLRIKNISREVHCLEESLNDGSFGLKLDSDLEEVITIRSHLQNKMKQLTEDLEALTYTRDQYQTSLSLYSGEESGDEQGSEIIRLKHGINQLRMKLMRSKTSRQDQEMYAKMSDFEVELVRQNRG